MEFWLVTICLTVACMGISFIFGKKRPALQFGIPALLMMLSVVVIIASFAVGRWNGMILGGAGLSLLLASTFSLIMLSLFRMIKG
ncbi:YesK family protein [Bacillus swezeyi]|uniref:YesK family protein n=1 Tax=Bacillus swezeyi TaxID=1925020 RepID=UPI0027DCE57B|nr:YesK family protein [Bacillus swezeyi]